MSRFTMSTSSSSRATASPDESDYVTAIRQRDPRASVVEDPSEDTRDSAEISSDSTPSQQREALLASVSVSYTHLRAHET